MKHLQKLGYIAIGAILTLAVIGKLTLEVAPINIQVKGETI